MAAPVHIHNALVGAIRAFHSKTLQPHHKQVLKALHSAIKAHSGNPVGMAQQLGTQPPGAPAPLGTTAPQPLGTRAV